MQSLTRLQLALLIPLTLVWGLNWPVMKLGVTGYPPLSFRALSIGIGLPVLALALIAMKVPFRVPRRYWPELLWLGTTNMVIWQALIIVSIKHLPGGRAAILGYSMPIFSAVLGALVFGALLSRRSWLGVSAAAVGVALLLWHELTALAGEPGYVALALAAAASWALGTQLLRRTTLPLHTLTIAFWMTALTAVVIGMLSWLFERDQWQPPPATTWGAIGYNAVLIFGFAQPAWFALVRGLPPVASTLSVMLIPVLGVFSSALWLGEVLHWQDLVAVALMVLAIGSVLWPSRPVTLVVRT